jgi:hypothetical protein
MKKIGVLVLSLGLATGVYAIPFEVPGDGQDSPKNGANSPAADFSVLTQVISAWNTANPANMLPVPVLTGNKPTTGPHATDLSGFEYAVLHYGKGDGGSNPGGGIEVWFLNGASSFDFPSTGSGPNGMGGFSSIVLFGPQVTVPDSGTTVVLLGLALSTLGLIRRRLV